MAGLDLKEVNLSDIASKCVERLFSGRDIQNLCQQAIMNMIHDANKELDKLATLPFAELRKRSLKIRPFKNSDLESAFEKIKSPISKKDIERYEKWNVEYGG